MRNAIYIKPLIYTACLGVRSQPIIPIAIGIAKHYRTGFLGNAVSNSEESHEKSSDVIGSPRFPKL